MVKIGNMEMSTEEFNELFPTAEERAIALRTLTTPAKATRKTTKKKPAINGAPLDLEGVEIVEKDDGTLNFKHEKYVQRRKQGYTLSDLQTADSLIEAKDFASTNAKTGIRYVNVNGAPIGENLVHYAKQQNLF